MVKSRFKITIIILVLILFILPITSLKVQATTTGSGTDADGPAATQTAAGGPSHSKTGWLIYVMDESTNSLLSADVRFYYCHQAPPDTVSVTSLKTRFNNPCSGSSGQIFDYIGEPFDDSGRGRGAEIKQFLVTPQEDGISGAVKLITKIWGEEFTQSLATNANWVLCLESVYWYNIYLGGQPTEIINIGTAQMIGTMQSQVPVLSPIGDSWINKLTNGWFALCAMVEGNAKLGITPPSTTTPKISNDLMATQGYGMIQAWPVDGNMIPTYDGVNSPGDPPDNPKGGAVIVKSYHEVDKTNNTDEAKGTYSRSIVSNNILILDEPEYKVENWKVTDSKNMSLGGKYEDWNLPGNVQGTMGSGTGPGSTRFYNIHCEYYPRITGVLLSSTKKR